MDANVYTSISGTVGDMHTVLFELDFQEVSASGDCRFLKARRPRLAGRPGLILIS
jgi:hypothetical protein